MNIMRMPATMPYQEADLYEAAGMVREEIELMPRYLAGVDEFMGSSAFYKLFDYFMNTGEMPYEVGKARTECPDDWILERLAT